MFNLNNLIKDTKTIKLLYVEDNKEARESTLLMLGNLFDDIIVAIDGKDGLEKFKNNTIDLVITDINMPHMNGLEMSRAIKLMNYNQSIMILTALTNISHIKEAVDIGINCFINKPIEDIEILFNKIEPIVKRIQYDRNLKELEIIREKKEKIHLILEIIRNISHHWRQPLSVISLISSGCSLKIANNIELTDNDLKGAKIITQKINELSSVLQEIEEIDFDTIEIEDIKSIIQISHPIYEYENENE